MPLSPRARCAHQASPSHQAGIIDRLVQASVVLESQAGGGVLVRGVNCSAPMSSGRSILQRWAAELTRGGRKPRIPSPLAFTVSNGEAPKLIPPKLLKGTSKHGEGSGSSTLPTDVKALIQHVSSATKPRSVQRLKKPDALSQCMANARICAVLMYSLPLPPTSTKNVFTKGLDASLALKSFRGERRDVQLGIMNSTKHRVAGAPPGLQQLLPAGLGKRSVAASDAVGTLVVLRSMSTPACTGSDPPGKGAGQGRHLATVVPFQGELTSGVLRSALAQAEDDASVASKASCTDPTAESPAVGYPPALTKDQGPLMVEGLIGAASVRVRRQSLVLQPQRSKARARRRRKEQQAQQERAGTTPPTQPTQTPAATVDATASAPQPQDKDAEEAARREAAVRARMEAEAADFLPQAVEEEEQAEGMEALDDADAEELLFEDDEEDEEIEL